MNNLLLQDGNYVPIETDVNIAGLTTKQNQMKAATDALIPQIDDLGRKRILRNTRFYLDDDCLIAVGKGIKKYIRGKYGIHSAQFAQISSITFKDYKIK